MECLAVYLIILDTVTNRQYFCMFWIMGEVKKSWEAKGCSRYFFLSTELVIDISLLFFSEIFFSVVEKDTFIMSELTYLKCTKLWNL